MSKNELYQFLVGELVDIVLVSKIMDAIDSHIETITDTHCCQDDTDDEYALMSAGIGVDEDYVCAGGFEDGWEM